MDDQNQTMDPAGPGPGLENPTGLTITQTIRQYWHECSRWGLFFAVLGFVYIGFLVLLTIGVSIADQSIFRSIFSLLIGGGIVFIFSWLMLQFAQNLRKALDMDSTPAADRSFQNLKFLYQVAGIVLIAVLALYGIGIIIMMVVFANQ